VPSGASANTGWPFAGAAPRLMPAATFSPAGVAGDDAAGLTDPAAAGVCDAGELAAGCCGDPHPASPAAARAARAARATASRRVRRGGEASLITRTNYIAG
jgi:hypothetical protein